MSYTIAIHNLPGSFSDRWIDLCRENAVKYLAVNCYDTNIIERLSDADALLWNWNQTNPEDLLMARQLITFLERTGVVTFPNAITSWHFDDKIAQKYLLESVAAPLVPTYVFFQKEDALRWIGETTFPKVFKLRCGAGSGNVRLIRSRREANRLCRKMFSKGMPAVSGGYFSDFRRKVHMTKGFGHFMEKQRRMPSVIKNIVHQKRFLHYQKGYLYFQDFLSGNLYDTRVTIIGGRAFAFMRMNRPGDFRASGSGRLVYDMPRIDPLCVRTAFETAKKIDAQSMAYDFVFDENNEPKIVEISYTYMPQAVRDCPGYWDRDLKWHDGHYWPQDLVFQDLLDDLRGKIDHE
jgi:glutathione synthase/RimK-type ligase-like ATP-grasp enzyme